MLIPQIDVQKTRQAIMEMTSIIPSRKMFETVLLSIDAMMDDIVSARDDVDSSKSSVKNALKKWDAIFESFGEREAVYYQEITEAMTEDELEKVAYQPLLEGEYHDQIEPPDWPDIETPWRLMNSLALIAAEAGKGKTYFEGLKGRWMDNFARFWSTSAFILSQQAQKPLALVETVSLEGPGSNPEEEPSLYDQAAAKARGVMEDVEDFFSGKTVGEAKKAAKHVGIGLGVGLFVGVAVAALVFFKLRR